MNSQVQGHIEAIPEGKAPFGRLRALISSQYPNAEAGDKKRDRPYGQEAERKTSGEEKWTQCC